MWSVAETLAQQQSVRWLTLPMAVLALLADGVLVWTGVQTVFSMRPRAGSRTSA